MLSLRRGEAIQIASIESVRLSESGCLEYLLQLERGRQGWLSASDLRTQRSRMDTAHATQVDAWQRDIDRSAALTQPAVATNTPAAMDTPAAPETPMAVMSSNVSDATPLGMSSKVADATPIASMSSSNLGGLTGSNPTFESTMLSKRRRLSESHVRVDDAMASDDLDQAAASDQDASDQDISDQDASDQEGEDYVPDAADEENEDDDDDVRGHSSHHDAETLDMVGEADNEASAHHDHAHTHAHAHAHAHDDYSPAGEAAEDGYDNDNDDDDDDDDYHESPAFSDEYLRRQRNIAMLKAGNITVERQTVLPHLLHLTAAERKCYEPFRPHFGLRTAESDKLVKKKTLGMSRPRKFKTGAFLGVARPAVAGADKIVPCEPLVLWRPDESSHEKAKPIELENFICHWLRPHQRSGVQFLFDCVTGLKEFGGEGCILADDMGLGKTLMSIALIWIVLRHSFEGPEGPKICKNKKIVVCCPTSLVFNWNNEVEKWLKGKVKCIAVGNSGYSVAKDIGDFFAPRCPAEVLVLSYETFRTYKEVFYKPGKVDLLICDEAHRLKNDQTQTSVTLAALPTLKRVLLSGTPLQNRLDEFYAMVNFCNPGVLGTPNEFRRNFERPILAGMEPDCTDEVTLKAKTTSAKLSGISNQFILRRTNALLAKHLPTKLVQIVCCKPTPLQVQLYNHFLNSKSVKKAMRESENSESGGGAGGQVLGVIQSLSKLCNHPRLVYPNDAASRSNKKKKGAGGAGGFEDAYSGCAHLFPDNFDVRGDSRCFGGGGPRKTSRGSSKQVCCHLGMQYWRNAVLGQCSIGACGGKRVCFVSTPLLRHMMWSR